MKAIIEVFINGIEGKKTLYVRTFGRYAGWTEDIYKAKIYRTVSEAEKKAKQLKEHIIDFYNNGYTTYGWDENCNPTTKNIETTVHGIELKIID